MSKFTQRAQCRVPSKTTIITRNPMVYSRYYLIVLAIFFAQSAAFAAQPANPDKCIPDPATNKIAFKWSTSDPKLALLKKLEDLLNKIPLVKKVTFSADVNGSIKFGEECCPGAQKPSKYTEYTGGGSASFTLDFIGLGLKINPSITIPVPWTGVDLAGTALAEVSLSGGGKLSAKIDAAGRDGDCDCFTITIEGALSPQVAASVKGFAFVGYIGSDGVLHGLTLDIGASATVYMTVSIPKWQIPVSGASCKPGAGPQVLFKWPTFKFDVVFVVPIWAVPDFNYTWEIDLLPLIGLPKESLLF